MPTLRVARPIIRASAAVIPGALLPTEPAIDQDTRVAVFDGGLPADTPLSPWVRHEDALGVGVAHGDHVWHGQAVTSDLLFGSLSEDEIADRPYAQIDHYRVIDKKAEADPYELYDVLQRIEDVLTTKRYDFINLSLGPALPVEDDDVHAWTAVLDEYLSNGSTLATIAVGNNGENDPVLAGC